MTTKSTHSSTHTEYHPNEVIAARGPLSKDGQKHGTWFFYAEEGSLVAVGNYQHGQKHGKWTTYDRKAYHTAPQRVSVKRYVNGECLESWSLQEDAPRSGTQPSAKPSILDEDTAQRLFAEMEPVGFGKQRCSDSEYEYWASHYDGHELFRCGTLDNALEYINAFTERTQMTMVLWRRNVLLHSTELYMVYPFPQLLSADRLAEQLCKIKELYESDLSTREEFYERLNDLRTRCYSNQLHK